MGAWFKNQEKTDFENWAYEIPDLDPHLEEWGTKMVDTMEEYDESY
jgi:hypothetical protein